MKSNITRALLEQVADTDPILFQKLEVLFPLIVEILESPSMVLKREKADKILEILNILPLSHNWLSDKLEVSDSDTEGAWVYVKQWVSITSWELVAVFWGKVHTIDQWLSLPREVQMWHIMVSGWHTMGAWSSLEVDNGDYVNHSCDPTCWLVGQTCLYALKNIFSGEEITFDYGTVLWLDQQIVWRLPAEFIDQETGVIVLIDDCNCGTDICRWRVTAEDRKILKDSKKLQGFFSPHVQRLITET